MTLGEWLGLLERRHPLGIDMGLGRTGAVLARMLGVFSGVGAVVVVGGTNGKGSVCAFVEGALNAAGFRCGAYFSPHLLRFNERVRIGGEEAGDDALLDAFAKTEKARLAAGVSLTYFEFATLAAAQCITDADCDCAVLEVGMGGRLDAVNVFSPSVSVVTNAGLDHCEYLGGTVAEIAREKAGIFRAGVAAVVGDSDAPRALLDAAEEKGARVMLAGREFSGTVSAGGGWDFRGGGRRLFNLPAPMMRGEHQMQNAAAALAALSALPGGFWPGAGAARRALATVALPGRAQVFAGEPVTVVDVAHNPPAAAALEQFLFAMGYFPRTVAVFGMHERKDARATALELRRRVDEWFVFSPDEGGDCSPLAAAVRAACGGGTVVNECADFGEALRRARAGAGKNDRITVTGSFSAVAGFFRSKMRSE